jgi:hypothetical protein
MVGDADWRPAGDVSELAELTAHKIPAQGYRDVPGTYGALDEQFQWGSPEIFRDPEVWRSSSSPSPSPAPTYTAPPKARDKELNRTKDRVSELTVHLDLLYKRVTELEASQTNLMRELADKEAQLKAQTAATAAAAAAAAAAPPPAPPYQPVSQPNPGFENLLRQVVTVLSATQAAAVAPPAPPLPPTGSASAVTLNSFRVVEAAASPAPPPPPAPVPVEPPSAAPATLRIATSPPLKVVETAAPAPVELPEIVISAEPDDLSAMQVPVAQPQVDVPVPAPASVPSPVPEPLPVPDPAPAQASAPAVEPPPLAFDWNALVPAPAPQTSPPQPEPFPTPAPMPQLPPTSAVPNLFAPPPADRGMSEISAFPTAPPPPPVNEEPQFPAANRVISEFSMPATEPPPNASTQEVLARLAKPADEPTEEKPRRSRSNLALVAGAGFLVTIMTVAGYFFLRHPKDLKQMAQLDDGRAGVGAELADDNRTTKVPVAPPASAGMTAPAPVAASAANIGAAITLVKEFPLSGDRRSVGQWLQYSYSANPGAGKESWSASETADKTYLVEYRFDPSSPGAPNVHYLFEADLARGFVSGKNQEASRMLAGESKRSSRQLKVDAAIRLVKEFPLDGERGSVAEWLTRSAGMPPAKESWTATEVGEKSFVIEYHRAATRRLAAAHYLFAADTKNGFVIGKNLDARRLLAGGGASPPRRFTRKAVKPAPKKKAPEKRALPRASSRPQAADDGFFGTDTVRPN